MVCYNRPGAGNLASTLPHKHHDISHSQENKTKLDLKTTSLTQQRARSTLLHSRKGKFLTYAAAAGTAQRTYKLSPGATWRT